ncbi:MAG: hydrogen gas-evolving membrane-bound hydrogenase subunit E [Euryarchaeota archaeon]|nr:hydrogen gas-evolving membrane-bound hydrogenase subunit E [Euryarchaeota archaeon]
MKSMSIAALLFVLFLGALFVYVAEDIPAFGDANSAPNRYVWLFDMDAAGIEDDLNQGNIPTILGNTLEGRGFPLPSGVAKLKEGEWDAVIIPEEKHYYPKEQKYYFIEKKGDKLDVYRYSLYIRFVEEGEDETLVPNMVTYILADYRGYDTLGETTVIFTAGVAVLLLLRRKEKRPE